MFGKLTISIVVLMLVFIGYTELERLGLVGKTVCDSTLEYSIGRFDQGFDITQSEFISVLAKSESVWEDVFEKNMLQYNPEASFKINVIFDERQKIAIEENVHLNSLKELEDSYLGLVGAREDFRRKYELAKAEYQFEIGEYESRLNTFNKLVSSWNKKGGAPAGVFEKMQMEEKELRSLLVELDLKRVSLNEMVTELNQISSASNTLASKYNAQAGSYREKYGTPREFSQGEYTGDRINIYQFDDKSHLALILAHELGHALNLKHVENPHSIMYYLMDEQDIDNPSLTQEDIEALKTECRIK